MIGALHTGRARTLTLALLIVPALVVAMFAMGDSGTAQAGQPCLVAKGEFCLTLDPAEDTNPVGSDHTVTAEVTGDSEPLVEVGTLILVADGPNAGENVVGFTDSNGELGLTYTGDGGAGTDIIGALACLDCGDAEAYLQGFAEKCISIPEKCAGFFEGCDQLKVSLEEAGPVIATVGATLCVSATKVWEEAEETPSPTATEQPGGEGGVDVEVSDDDVEVGEEVDVTATVADENGDPVVGEDCMFSIVSQPGDDASVDAGPVTSDENGQATTSLSAGSTAGTVQVQADCGVFSAVLDVVVSPAALPATGGGEPDSTSWAWLSALLVAAGAVALTGSLAMRRRS
ncbi:MAG: hypothetical protein WEE64_06295 [Dehalococcoidia bacterium]